MSATAVTQEKVQERIIEAIVSFGPDREDVTPGASFEELDVDSLDLAELAQIAEDEFGVKIGSSDVEGLKTVGDAVELVAARAS
jgi:acyl carrier protein